MNNIVVRSPFRRFSKNNNRTGVQRNSQDNDADEDENERASIPERRQSFNLTMASSVLPCRMFVTSVASNTSFEQDDLLLARAVAALFERMWYAICTSLSRKAHVAAPS